MSKVRSQTEVHQAQDVGSPLQCDVQAATVNLAATVPGSGSIQSAVIPTGGYKFGAFAAKLDQAGQISVQRYLDAAGTIPQGAAITAALTANTWGVANLPGDNLVFQSLKITLTDSSATAANVVGTQLTLQAG